MITDITIIFVLYKSDDIIFENLKNLKNFKKIIIDNDPSSRIRDKIINFDKNITYHKMHKNLGMSKAANFALNLAKTDFILYLTADTIMNEKNIPTYTNLQAIEKEVDDSKKLFKKYNWPTIDVTRKSVEETAASIIKIYDIQKDK